MKKYFTILIAALILFGCTQKSKENKIIITNRSYLPESFVFEDLGDVSFATITDNVVVSDRFYKELSKEGYEGLNKLIESVKLIEQTSKNIIYLYEFKFSQINNSHLFFLIEDDESRIYYFTSFDLLSSNLETATKQYECNQQFAQNLIELLK